MIYFLLSQGITFNLIIIRVHDGQTSAQASINPLDFDLQPDRRSFPLHGIQVHTTMSRYRDPEPIPIPSDLARPPESKSPIVWMAE